MKKFFSLVLALVMALSLTTVAWAADPTPVSDATTLKAALDAGEDVIFQNNIIVAAELYDHPTKDFYAGIIVPDGVTVDGNGYTLTVTGAGDITTADTDKKGNSWDSAIYSSGGLTVKNLTIVGGIRGIYIISPTSDVVFDNVTILESCRAFNVTDTAAGMTLTVSNSTLAGKISYSSFDAVNFINCEFVTNNNVKGDALEPRTDTVISNCEFEEGFELSLEDFPATAEMALTNCTYAGEPLTADNMDDLFTNTTGVDLDEAIAVSHATDGASNTYTGLYAGATTEGANIVAIDSLNFFKAVDNEVDEDGEFEEYGNVAYYTVSGDQYFNGKYYVEVKTLAKADVVVSTDAAGKNVYMYLDQIEDPFYYGDGVKTTNFGTACGQYNSKNPAYDKKATYYVAFETLYVGDKVSPSEWLMVNGELVGVDVAFDDVVAHATVFTRDEDSEITAIKCSKCGAVAVKAPNFLSIPKGAVRVAGTDLWYWGAAAASTDKVVESAETFDAGIAMYVGMSVMAAAGSAVVLKKKD